MVSGVLRTRSQRWIVVLIALGVFLIVADVIVSRVWKTSSGPAVEAGSISSGRLAVGTLLDKPVPNLTLVDERGNRVPLSSFRGRYLVFAPSLTLCHEVCPLTTGALMQLEGICAGPDFGTASPWRRRPSIRGATPPPEYVPSSGARAAA